MRKRRGKRPRRDFLAIAETTLERRLSSSTLLITLGLPAAAVVSASRTALGQSANDAVQPTHLDTSPSNSLNTANIIAPSRGSRSEPVADQVHKATQSSITTPSVLPVQTEHPAADRAVGKSVAKAGSGAALGSGGNGGSTPQAHGTSTPNLQLPSNTSASGTPLVVSSGPSVIPVSPSSNPSQPASIRPFGSIGTAASTGKQSNRAGNDPGRGAQHSAATNTGLQSLQSNSKDLGTQGAGVASTGAGLGNRAFGSVGTIAKGVASDNQASGGTSSLQNHASGLVSQNARAGLSSNGVGASVGANPTKAGVGPIGLLNSVGSENGAESRSFQGLGSAITTPAQSAGTTAAAVSQITSNGPSTSPLSPGANLNVKPFGSSSIPVLPQISGNGTTAKTPSTKFYVVDAATQTLFRYGGEGAPLGSSALASSNPRSTTSDASGDTVWVIDSSGRVDLYNPDGSLRGSWIATMVANPSGIATDGVGLWILDAGQGIVDYFAGAASRTTGSQSPTSSFALSAGNSSPKGITTDGTNAWVVDASSQVFVYSAATGAMLGSWRLDPNQLSPAGITLDPSGGTDLWVVDQFTKEVYRYSDAMSWRSGSRGAASVFSLASGDTDPIGIADPLAGNGGSYSPLGDGLAAANLFLGNVSLPANPFGSQLGSMLYDGSGNPQPWNATNEAINLAPSTLIPDASMYMGPIDNGLVNVYGLSGSAQGFELGQLQGFGSYSLPLPHGGEGIGYWQRISPYGNVSAYQVDIDGYTNLPGPPTSAIISITSSSGGDQWAWNETLSEGFSESRINSMTETFDQFVRESYTLTETIGSGSGPGTATETLSGFYYFETWGNVNGPYNIIEYDQDTYTYQGVGSVSPIPAPQSQTPNLVEDLAVSGLVTLQLSGGTYYSFSGYAAGGSYLTSYSASWGNYESANWTGALFENYSDGLNNGSVSATGGGSAVLDLSITDYYSNVNQHTLGQPVYESLLQSGTYGYSFGASDQFTGTGDSESDAGGLSFGAWESGTFDLNYSGTLSGGTTDYSLLVSGNDSGGDAFSLNGGFSGGDTGSMGAGYSDAFSDGYTLAGWNSGAGNQYSDVLTGGGQGTDYVTLSDSYVTLSGGATDNVSDQASANDWYSGNYTQSFWNLGTGNYFSLNLANSDGGGDSWSGVDNFSDAGVVSGNVTNNDSGAISASGGDSYTDQYLGIFSNPGSVLSTSITVGGSDNGYDSWSGNDHFYDITSGAGSGGDVYYDTDSGSDYGSGNDTYTDAYSGLGSLVGGVASYNLNVFGTDSGADAWSGTDNFSDSDIVAAAALAAGYAQGLVPVGTTYIDDSDQGVFSGSGNDAYNDGYSGTTGGPAGAMVYSLSISGGDGGSDSWTDSLTYLDSDQGAGLQGDAFTDTDSGTLSGSGGDSYGDGYSGTAWELATSAALYNLYSLALSSNENDDDAWSGTDNFSDTNITATSGSAKTIINDSDAGLASISGSDWINDSYSGVTWNTTANVNAVLYSLTISGGDGDTEGWTENASFNDNVSGPGGAGLDVLTSTDSGSVGGGGGIALGGGYSGQIWDDASANSYYSLSVSGGDSGNDAWNENDNFTDTDTETPASGTTNPQAMSINDGDSGTATASGSDSFGDAYSGLIWNTIGVARYSLGIDGGGSTGDGWSINEGFHDAVANVQGTKTESDSGTLGGGGSDSAGGTYSGTIWNNAAGSALYSLAVGGDDSDSESDSGFENFNDSDVATGNLGDTIDDSDTGSVGLSGSANYFDNFSGSLWNIAGYNLYSLAVNEGDSGNDGWSLNDNFDDTDITSGSVTRVINDILSGSVNISGSDFVGDSVSGAIWDNNIGTSFYSLNVGGTDGGGDGWSEGETYHDDTANPGGISGETITDIESGSAGGSGSDSYGDGYSGTVYTDAVGSSLYNLTVSGSDGGSDTWSDGDTFDDTDQASGSQAFDNWNSGGESDSGSDYYGDSYNGSTSTGGYSVALNGSWGDSDAWTDSDAIGGSTSGQDSGSGSDWINGAYSGTQFVSNGMSGSNGVTVTGSGGDTAHDAGQANGNSFSDDDSLTYTFNGTDNYGGQSLEFSGTYADDWAGPQGTSSSSGPVSGTDLNGVWVYSTIPTLGFGSGSYLAPFESKDRATQVLGGWLRGTSTPDGTGPGALGPRAVDANSSSVNGGSQGQSPSAGAAGTLAPIPSDLAAGKLGTSAVVPVDPRGNGQFAPSIEPGGGGANPAIGPDASAIAQAGISQADTVAYQNGHVASRTDAMGHSTSYGYNSAGQLTSVTNPDYATTTIGYASGGQVSSVTDADGNTTSYTYNSQGQLLSVTDPLGHTTSYTYNSNGQVASATDRDGRTETYTYDSSNRLTAEHWYDAQGNQVDQLGFTYNSQGQLATAWNNQGSYTFTYNSQGQLSQETEPFNTTLSFTYDANGNVINIADSTGADLTSTYNAAGQLLSRQLSVPGESTIGVNFTYGVGGAIASETRTVNGNDVGQAGYAYDASGDLTDLLDVDGSGTLIDGFGYTYDGDGRVTSETDFYDAKFGLGSGSSSGSGSGSSGSGSGSGSSGYGSGSSGGYGSGSGSGSSSGSGSRGSGSGSGSTGTSSPGTSNYSYDSAGQLISAGSTSYSYDANGNRSAYQIGTGNRILSDGTWHYTYDAEGNRTGKTNPSTGISWAYTYDNANRLTSATETNSSSSVLYQVTYKYGVFGNRIEQDTTTAGQSTPTVQRYAYNGNMIWADLNGSNNVTMRYLNGDAVDQLLAREDSSGNVGWYLTDHLGSVRDIVDNSGNVQDHVDYDAFGNITIETNAALGGRYKFTGREYDATTGLYYNRARYYDPSTGSWTTRDPLGFNSGDMNPYRYVVNGPTDGIDPFGEFLDEWNGFWKGIGDGAATIADVFLVELEPSPTGIHARAEQAAQEAVERGDVISQVGFGIGKFAGNTIQAIAVVSFGQALVGIFPFLGTVLGSSVVTTTLGSVSAVVGVTSAVASVEAFASGDIIGGIDHLGQAFLNVLFAGDSFQNLAARTSSAGGAYHPSNPRGQGYTSSRISTSDDLPGVGDERFATFRTSTAPNVSGAGYSQFATFNVFSALSGGIGGAAKGAPKGTRTKINPDDAPENIRALTRENESADTLARLGYDVTQKPDVPGPKNPDYKINGNIYDNFAPSTSSPRNIWSVVKGKVESGQTSRIVLNLDDSGVSLEALSKQFSDWAIEGLEDVIIIKNGKVFHLGG